MQRHGMSWLTQSPRTIDLNFQPRSRRPNWQGWLALVIGVLTTLAAVLSHQELTTTYQLAQARLMRERQHDDATLRATDHAPAKRASDASLQALAALASQVSREDLGFLLGLESVTNDTVGILSLSIAQDNAHAALSAQAKDLPSAFAFAKGLAAMPGIKTAQITGYEFKQLGTVQVLAFNLVADWEPQQ
jgi:hypothetical protein